MQTPDTQPHADFERSFPWLLCSLPRACNPMSEKRSAHRGPVTPWAARRSAGQREQRSGRRVVRCPGPALGASRHDLRVELAPAPAMPKNVSRRFILVVATPSSGCALHPSLQRSRQSSIFRSRSTRRRNPSAEPRTAVAGDGPLASRVERGESVLSGHDDKAPPWAGSGSSCIVLGWGWRTGEVTQWRCSHGSWGSLPAGPKPHRARSTQMPPRRLQTPPSGTPRQRLTSFRPLQTRRRHPMRRSAPVRSSPRQTNVCGSTSRFNARRTISLPMRFRSLRAARRSTSEPPTAAPPVRCSESSQRLAIALRADYGTLRVLLVQP